MDIKALRAFVEVAQFRNISLAAISLGITQPSLSRIIGALETEFGGTLFHRTGRGVSLTPLGEAALPRARGLLAESEQLRADMRELGRSPAGNVTLAMLPSLMRAIAGDLYEEVHRSYPGVRLRMLEGFGNQIEEWLADGRTDIALLSRYRVRKDDHGEVITTSNLMLVGRPEPVRGRGTVKFSRLAGLPLVLPAPPNGLRIAVEDTARHLHFKPQVVVEADSLEAQKAIVSRGGCYAVLSPQTVQREVAAGLLQARPIVDPMLPRLVVMLTTTRHPLGRAAREVGHIARRLMAQHDGTDA